jgi:hypothetical protein
MSTYNLTLTLDEAPGLVAAMRDLQSATRSYYDDSTGFVDGDYLATPAKNAVVAVQTLHELLWNQYSGKDLYGDLFANATDLNETILAFKYLRNVIQHVIHPVEPSENSAVGGTGLGFRTYCSWSAVPDSVHQQLRAGTRALRVHFENRLAGRSVTETLLDALCFFSVTLPGLVHRQANGEWTGFPLRHQAGVQARLHPEEPKSEAEAIEWLASRLPGADRRLILGAITTQGARYTYGANVVGRALVSPFFESSKQLQQDIDRGYPYYRAELDGRLTSVTIPDRCDAFKHTTISHESPDTWMGSPLTDPPAGEDFCLDHTEEYWLRQLWWETESSQGYTERRMRRLCAWYPIA